MCVCADEDKTTPPERMHATLGAYTDITMVVPKSIAVHLSSVSHDLLIVLNLSNTNSGA